MSRVQASERSVRKTKNSSERSPDEQPPWDRDLVLRSLQRQSGATAVQGRTRRLGRGGDARRQAQGWHWGGTSTRASRTTPPAPSARAAGSAGEPQRTRAGQHSTGTAGGRATPGSCPRGHEAAEPRGLTVSHLTWRETGALPSFTGQPAFLLAVSSERVTKVSDHQKVQNQMAVERTQPAAETGGSGSSARSSGLDVPDTSLNGQRERADPRRGRRPGHPATRCVAHHRERPVKEKRRLPLADKDPWPTSSSGGGQCGPLPARTVRAWTPVPGAAGPFPRCPCVCRGTRRLVRLMDGGSLGSGQRARQRGPDPSLSHMWTPKLTFHLTGR